MKGWTGRVLRVDLGEGRIWEEELKEDVLRNFIGGRGLGINYLLREADPKGDPFCGKNPLIMMAGPLTGTGAPQEPATW